MTAQGATPPTGGLVAVARIARAHLRHGGRRAALALLLAAGLGAWASATAGAPALASGEKGGEGGGSPGESTSTSSCPASNPPNQMTLVAGTPQTATLGSAFASSLQVALGNSDGCPVTSAAAGIPVTFSAPASGASGAFSTSASNTVIVGADASGTVAAPPFTANTTAGSYTVTASSRYGSVSFSLTNTAAGIPARILVISPKRLSARVLNRYPQPLQVRVLDASGNPVAGTTVTFTVGSGASSTCAATSSSGASATFAGVGAQATATTGANGGASSPLLTANSTAGSFTVTAAVSGKESNGAPGKENSGASPGGTATPVSFSLSNLAGRPTMLTPGVGSTQSTLAGTRFPIPLAVTVADAQRNPVPGALITFSAPIAGASGRFTGPHPHPHRVRVAHPHTVEVKTDACGIAVAPTFTANDTQGGYIVKATVEHARPAAFALVNEAPGQAP